VADTFGMSDVWSTMAGECGQGDGLHLTTEGHAVLEVIDPETAELLPLEDGVTGELVWTHLNRRASPLLRYRSSDLATVSTVPCACGRTSPRIRIGGRRDDMLRVQAVNVYPQAIGEVLDRLGASGGYAVVADGDPIAAPLQIYVESPQDADNLRDELREALRTEVALIALAAGDLPVAEQKTPRVFRTARGDALPDAIRRHREAP
jgi:phenylacetate-CoA ligase